MQLAGAAQRADELCVVEGGVLEASGVLAVDLALNQLAEHRRDRSGFGEGAEVGPGLVGNATRAIRLVDVKSSKQTKT